MSKIRVAVMTAALALLITTAGVVIAAAVVNLILYFGAICST